MARTTGKFAKFTDRRKGPFAARVSKATRLAMAGVVRTHAEMVREHIKASMKEEKTGRIYTLLGGWEHQASAPGESPAIATGNLFNSIKVRTYDRGLAADVGSFNVPYAGFLEKGTRRMLPRPFLAPALQSVAGRFRLGMAKIVLQSLSL